MARGIPIVEQIGQMSFKDKAGGNAHTNFALVGTVTLAAGTATVATTRITATSFVIATNSKLGTVAAPKFLTITRSNGVSFTITSTDNTDTSVISYIMIPDAS